MRRRMWVSARQYTGRIVTVTNDKIFDTPVYNYTTRVPVHLGGDAHPCAVQRRPQSRRADSARRGPAPDHESPRTRGGAAQGPGAALHDQARGSRARALLPPDRQLVRNGRPLHRRRARGARRQGPDEPRYPRRLRRAKIEIASGTYQIVGYAGVARANQRTERRSLRTPPRRLPRPPGPACPARR